MDKKLLRISFHRTCIWLHVNNVVDMCVCTYACAYICMDVHTEVRYHMIISAHVYAIFVRAQWRTYAIKHI